MPLGPPFDLGAGPAAGFLAGRRREGRIVRGDLTMGARLDAELRHSRHSRSTYAPVTGNDGSSMPSVRTLEAADAATCDDIIASLPDWFGMPEGIRDCAKDVRTQSGLVCERHRAWLGS